MEYKSISFDLKAVGEDVAGDEWIIEGYASTYDLDLGKDMIQKGAFVKTIQQRFFDQRAYNGKSKIKILWQHDTEDLIGSLLDLREDEKGLYCRIQIFRDPVFVSAQKAYRLAKYGEIDSFSIGYKPITWEDTILDDGTEVRLIKELKLFEISVVTFPMNEKAEFTNVKEEELKSVNESKAIELLTEIKSMLEQFGTKLPEFFGVKSAESVVEVETKRDCKSCGEPMKMMCPSCDMKSEEVSVTPEVPVEVKTEDILETISAKFASLRDELAASLTDYINEKLKEEKAEVVAEEVKEEVSTTEVTSETTEVVEAKNDAEPTELKLEDILDFFLTKEFNL